MKATRTAPTRLRFHRIFTHRREESPANYWFPVRGESAWERGEFGFDAGGHDGWEYAMFQQQ